MTPGVDRAADLAAITAGEQLAATYRDIGRRTMRDLPVYNATLDVCAVGFRPHDGGVLGVLVTPWFMNLVVLADAEAAPPAGTTVPRRFPAGTIDFTVSEVAGRRVDSASLFSPMFAFDHPAAARAVAQAALAALFEPAREAPAARPGLDRRAMLFGGRRLEERP